MLKSILEKIGRWAVSNPYATSFIESNDWLHRKVNGLLINSIVNSARARPHPWSTIHSYTSWDSLTDKTWSARHLAEKQQPAGLPTEIILTDFFKSSDPQILSTKSTCLFPAFAQHLTDGFIRTGMPKAGQNQKARLRNTSNHNIDLSPLYGRTVEHTNILRMQSNQPGEKGKLKFQVIGGEIFAPYLFNKKFQYSESVFRHLDPPLSFDLNQHKNIADGIFAFGGDRANAAPQVAMINTLFLREHNRLAEELENNNGGWDDERVFQTARNAVIVLYINIVVEEYINHISPALLKFRADPSIAWTADWNRPNWITTEFSLLYRWHSLIPGNMTWGNKSYEADQTFLNNKLFEDNGLKNSFIELSKQPSGQLGAFNTTSSFLLGVEKRAIAQGRLAKLASYNDYREYVGLPPVRRFKEYSSKQEINDFLEKHYKDVNDVDFYVGLFGEDLVKNSPLPELMLRMVALDAFSQALTNPLLSKPVFEQKEKVFGKAGMKAIENTHSLKDVLERNIKGNLEEYVGMDLQS